MSADAAPQPSRLILLGRISGGFGVRGECKLESWTEPRDAIFRYQPWTLRDPHGVERVLARVRGRDGGKQLIVQVPGVADRDAADALRGCEVLVPRAALPPPAAGEYYWVDLEGLAVVTVEGVPLGLVSHLFATGANDVLVVHDGERERLLPFVQPNTIKSVDFDAARIVVDWDPEF